jgi:hypothetical protein
MARSVVVLKLSTRLKNVISFAQNVASALTMAPQSLGRTPARCATSGLSVSDVGATLRDPLANLPQGPR